MIQVYNRKQRYSTRDNEAGEYGLIVRAREGENFETLMKRFKRKVSKDGIIQEVRNRVFYEKPSIKKARKRRENIQRLKLEESKKFDTRRDR